ncbi:hypothetical protein [Streptococcus suis]|uniref:hypothetical protein n=1 Tax=Streptococcus suis TaxID=1307 RepID=UPI00137B5C2F|nr:hypothetical protein [Streptococcus suis]
MLDTPPNRYHCISKTPQRLLGAFLLPEFQKNSIFSKFDRKILTFISDVFKNCRFCGQKKTLSRGLEKLIYGVFF